MKLAERGILLVALMLCVVTPACAGDQGQRERRWGRRRGVELTENDRREAIEYGGIKRTYIVHVPPSYDGSEPAPLMFSFHGRGGTGEDQIKLSQMSSVADEHGFIVVYPDGVGRSWNAGHGTGEAEERGIDDVGFVAELIERLSRKYRIDSERIYASGMSNGGVFAHRLGCELGDRIAAVASVAAAMAPAVAKSCRPGRPKAVLMFHGTGDHIVPYKGGKTRGGGELLSVEETAALWRQLNRCPETARVTQDRGDAMCLTYGPCQGGVEVTLCEIRGGGHTWPGGYQYAPRLLIGKTSDSVNASEEIWSFFSDHDLTPDHEERPKKPEHRRQ